MTLPDATDESGAVLAFVALGLVVFMGCAAIAIDLGNVWAHRRAVSTASDAAALAAAQDYAVGNTGCGSTAASYVARNLDGAALTSCTHQTTSPGAGRIDLGATVHLDHWFAPVVGISSTDVAASTSAFYGGARGADAVRPVALCTASPAYQAWGGGVPSNEIFIPFDLADPTACGNATTGAWAIVGVPCGAGAGAVGDGFGQRITPPQPACFEDETLAGVAAAIDTIRAAGEPVAIPVFELIGEVPKIVALAGVEFMGPMVTSGSPTEIGVPVRFTATVTTGECCSTSIGRGVRVVGICRTDGIGTSCP